MDIQKQRKEEDLRILKFLGEKVNILVNGSDEIIKTNPKILNGRILQDTTGNLIFLEKGKRNRCLFLTFGLYDGWVSTLTIKEIKGGWI